MSDDTSSWYQRKLAQIRGQQAPAQARLSTQPAQAYSQQQYASQYQPQRPQMVPQPQQPQQQVYSPQKGDTTIENFAEMMAYWKGGEGHRNASTCPRCGSGNFFSHQSSKRGPAPAPHCYGCGYNDGLFTQGDAATWGASR